MAPAPVLASAPALWPLAAQQHSDIGLPLLNLLGLLSRSLSEVGLARPVIVAGQGALEVRFARHELSEAFIKAQSLAVDAVSLIAERRDQQVGRGVALGERLQEGEGL